MKEKETKNEYEYKHLRICEKWLQRESCRKCLMEVLCHYEHMINETKRKLNWTKEAIGSWIGENSEENW